MRTLEQSDNKLHVQLVGYDQRKNKKNTEQSTTISVYTFRPLALKVHNNKCLYPTGAELVLSRAVAVSAGNECNPSYCTLDVSQYSVLAQALRCLPPPRHGDYGDVSLAKVCSFSK